MTDLNAGLASIWEKRRSLIEQRLVAIEAASAAVDVGYCSPDLRAEAAEQAHTLAGSLGAFGLPSASIVARQVEAILRGIETSVAETSRLKSLSQLLRRLIEQGPNFR